MAVGGPLVWAWAGANGPPSMSPAADEGFRPAGEAWPLGPAELCRDHVAADPTWPPNVWVLVVLVWVWAVVQ